MATIYFNDGDGFSDMTYSDFLDLINCLISQDVDARVQMHTRSTEKDGFTLWTRGGMAYEYLRLIHYVKSETKAGRICAAYLTRFNCKEIDGKNLNSFIVICPD